MATHSFFTRNFIAQRNAIRLGKCSHGNDAFASLDQLPRVFSIFCDTHISHHWTHEVDLDDAIAHIDQQGKKTLKGRMLTEIEAWNTFRQIAPNATVTSTALVKYTGRAHKSDVSIASSKVNAGEEGLDGEVIPVMDEDGPLDNGTWVTEAFPPGEGVITRKRGREQTRMATIMHLIRRLSVRSFVQLIADAPVLFVAWKAGSATNFIATTCAILPHYFLELPAWLNAPLTTSCMVFLNSALESSIMQQTVQWIHNRVGFELSDRLIETAPLQEENVIYRMVLAQAIEACKQI